MGCFSFYPTKIITTLEGGMVSTNDPQKFTKDFDFFGNMG